MKKYKLTKEKIKINNTVLYRIKALKNFSDVKKGELGGFIEKESNLSQTGDCWVYEKAKVYGKARVFENAWVYGKARICEKAKVYGKAKVCENHEIKAGTITKDCTDISYSL